MSKLRLTWYGAIFIAILCVALFLRLWGTSFGLPYRYHPDEPQHVVEAARMLAERRLEPSIFNNPPLYKYVLMAADGGYIGWHLLFTKDSNLQSLAESINLDPSPLYQLARAVSAICGTLTVAVVLLLGRSTYRPAVGLIAAIFMAVCFLHVRESHYGVNDATLTLFTTLALWSAILLHKRGRMADYLLAGVATGLAIATKYTAVFLLIPLAIAHLSSSTVTLNRPTTWGFWKVAVAAVGCLLALFVGFPHLFLDLSHVLGDVYRSIFTYGQLGFEGWQLDSAGGYLFYLKVLWWGLTPILSLIALCGLLMALIRHRKVDLILVSYPILLYLFMGRQQMYFGRFLLPILPPLLILGAEFTWMMLDRLSHQSGFVGSSRLQRAIIPLVVIVLVLQSAIFSARHNYLLMQEDTRTVAKEWIEKNLAEGTHVAVDWPHHGPPLSTEANPEPSSTKLYDLMVVGGHGLPDHSIDEYRAQGIGYLVVSSNIQNISLLDTAANSKRDAFYDSIERDLKVLAVFSPFSPGMNPGFNIDELYGPTTNLWQRQRPGPVVTVYQIPLTANAEVSSKSVDR